MRGLIYSSMSQDNRNLSALPRLTVIDYRSPNVVKQHRVRSLGEELCKLAMLATAFITYGNLGNPEKFIGFFLVLGIALWLIVIGFALAVHLRANAEFANRWPINRRWRLSLGLLAALSLAVMPGIMLIAQRDCPHGHSWSSQWVSVVHTNHCAPCHGDYNSQDEFKLNESWYIVLAR